MNDHAVDPETTDTGAADTGTAGPSGGFDAVVEVRLRAGIADPEGATIERALPALGFAGITGVRAGKSFRFHLDAPDEETASTEAATVADRLLANPVIEECTVTVTPSPAGRAPRTPS
jgi:phosphoribosylformylglycinamidine synthase PurS subunit